MVLYPAECANNKRARDSPPVRGASRAANPYWSAAAIEGLATYAGLPSALLSDVLGGQHPFHHAAVKPAEGGDGWPLVIFSHGLGGCASMYVQICAQLASFGYIIVAIEHEDGSGCHAQTASGELLRYKRPPDGFVYCRDAVVGFRRPFLAKRVDEIAAVAAALHRGAATAAVAPVETQAAQESLASLLKTADVSRAPLLVGALIDCRTPFMSLHQTSTRAGLYFSAPSAGWALLWRRHRRHCMPPRPRARRRAA